MDKSITKGIVSDLQSTENKRKRYTIKKKVNKDIFIDTAEEAIKKFENYCNNFNHIRDPHHFSIEAVRVKNGWLVIQWYDKHNWGEPKKEHKVLFTNGQIYENHKKIGSYI